MASQGQILKAENEIASSSDKEAQSVTREYIKRETPCQY